MFRKHWGKGCIILYFMSWRWKLIWLIESESDVNLFFKHFVMLNLFIWIYEMHVNQIQQKTLTDLINFGIIQNTFNLCDLNTIFYLKHQKWILLKNWNTVNSYKRFINTQKIVCKWSNKWQISAKFIIILQNFTQCGILTLCKTIAVPFTILFSDVCQWIE